MHPTELVLSPRLRTTPFEARVFENGIKSFTIYNHMTLPVNFTDTRDQYEHLCEHVQLWDVAAERQVEVVGRDALELMELITPRHVAPCNVGQCLYAPLVDQDGLVINDPIILRLADDRFWVSIADSDVMLWLKGIAWGRKLDVRVFEPDVSPLAVQGPKADDLMAELVGEDVRDIRFFWFKEKKIAGTDVLLARSGWSGQGGYEIYLQDSTRGLPLWDAVWEAGQKYNIRAGAPNQIERMETGLKSFGSDMTHVDHVLECALERYMNPDKPAEYMARDSMADYQQKGVARRLSNVMVPGEPLPGLRVRWDMMQDEKVIGYATSSAYSPKFGANLLFAMLPTRMTESGTPVQVVVDGVRHDAIVKDDRWK